MEFDTSYTFIIPENETDNRIDRYLGQKLPDVSRTYIQKLIKDGFITINNKPVKPNYRLAANDMLSLTFPRPSAPDIVPENIPIDIVYEDEDIIVVNKPKNMVVHPAPGHYQGTLVNALMYHCGDNLSGINGILRPGIVHRIDKDTTGLVIACKNDVSHNFIAEQLAEHSIKREYHAITFGALNNENNIIDTNIGRSKNDRKKMAVTKEPEGKHAVTHYNVLNNFEYKNNKYSYIECKLETGRTHQIRVHMSYIGHPLLGDTVYGYSKQPFKTDGQVLHAKTLGIIHPRTKKYMEFNSDLPEYFEKILKIISNNVDI